MRKKGGQAARELVLMVTISIWILGMAGCGGTAGAVPEGQVRLTVNVAEMENARGTRDDECGRVRIDEGVWGTNRSILVDPGTQATIEAAAEEGWRFEGWYLGENRVSGLSIFQLTLNADRTYTAKFTQGQGVGAFWMGNTLDAHEGEPDEQPVHQVTFTYDFWIDPHEVTFAQYEEFCAQTGIPIPDDEGWGGEDRPVINVSWWSAMLYCNWKSEQQGLAPAYNQTNGELLDGDGNPTTDITQVQGYRLPTEAEWEYGARGAGVDIDEGEEGHDFKYAGSDVLGNVGWYDGNSGGRTHPVGEKNPNECGLFDMSGNVYEWCHDYYEEDYYEQGNQQNPIGPADGSERVVRGGCWTNAPAFCRVSERASHDPREGDKYVGFRLAQTTMYTITAQSDPENGGEVRINEGEWSDHTSVTVGSHNQVSLEAQPEEGWDFNGWYDGATKVSDDLLFQVEATQNKTYNASFSEIPDFTLSAQADPENGGNVRIDGGAWGDQKSVTVQRGTLVDLEAQVEDGWGFEGWYEGETQMSETLLYQVEAQSNQTFQARFTEIPTYTIAAQSAPANGGNVRIDDGEWEDETSVTVPRDTEVTLEADAANGWDFNGWFEGSTKVSDNEIFQVVAEEDKTYSAKFSERTVWYTITAQSSPENGGDVRVNGGTWGDSKSATVQKGSQVTMEASPVNGWRFDGWYSGTTLVSGNATYQVVANSNKTYSARFKENLTFWMGNTRGDEDGHPNEEPVHGVYFTYTFWISPYELTFAEYDAYCADTGADYPFDNKWGRGTRPVIFVSWWDAIKYCNWLSDQQGYARAYNESTGGLLDSEGNSTTDISEVEGYRLPTEAEWEYSARGGSADISNAVEETDYRFSGSNGLEEVGWVIGSYGPTHPVGEKAPNELGTYDQSGNVIEWCYDWFGNYENGTEPITNPIGPSSGSKRIMRGGCIRSTEQTSRTADRDYIVPGERDWYLGFRIARTN